jgi:hypothetical protein
MQLSLSEDRCPPVRYESFLEQALECGEDANESVLAVDRAALVCDGRC